MLDTFSVNPYYIAQKKGGESYPAECFFADLLLALDAFSSQGNPTNAVTDICKHSAQKAAAAAKI